MHQAHHQHDLPVLNRPHAKRNPETGFSVKLVGLRMRRRAVPELCSHQLAVVDKRCAITYTACTEEEGVSQGSRG